MAELEAQEPAATLQHAPHLGQRRLDPRHVADAEGDRDGVDAAVGERQRLGIALHEVHPVAELAGGRALLADGQHVGLMSSTVTDRPSPAASMARKAMSPVPPATSSSAALRPPLRQRQPAHQRCLPGAVQAARHEVVHEVVAAGDAVEDARRRGPASPRAARSWRRNGCVAPSSAADIASSPMDRRGP